MQYKNLVCQCTLCSEPLSASRSISGMTTSCLMHCSAYTWHGSDQICNPCLRDVIPRLLDSQAQLWYRLWRRITWLYATINEVPQMLDGWQVSRIPGWGGQRASGRCPAERSANGLGRRARPRVESPRPRNVGGWRCHSTQVQSFPDCISHPKPSHSRHTKRPVQRHRHRHSAHLCDAILWPPITVRETKPGLVSDENLSPIPGRPTMLWCQPVKPCGAPGLCQDRASTRRWACGPSRGTFLMKLQIFLNLIIIQLKKRLYNY